MIANIKGLLVLTTTCFLSFSCTANNPDWVTQCEKTVEHFSKQASNSITYTPLPNLKQDEPFWSLSWSGLTIPIPDTQYKDVLINTEKNDDLGLTFVAENGARIFVGRIYGNDELKSLFEVVGESPSVEEIEWTKSAFGKPVRTTDLTDLAYQTTLDDIDCGAENQAKEAAKLAALVLKNVAPEVSAVHKLDMDEQNWVDIRSSFADKNSTAYTVNIVDGTRNNDEIKQISYVMPNNMGNFSLYSGISERKVNTNNPAWLKALNAAIKTKSNSDWVVYFEEAEKADISEKSLIASKSALKVE